MKVRFLPLSEMPFTGTLTLRSNASNGARQTVALAGTGEAPFTCGACNMPPASSCLSPSELLVHDPTGLCTDGQCRYTAHRVPCSAYCDPELALCVGTTAAGMPATLRRMPGALHQTRGWKHVIRMGRIR